MICGSRIHTVLYSTWTCISYRTVRESWTTQCPTSSISDRKLNQAFLVIIPLNTPFGSVTNICLAPSLTNICWTNSNDEWVCTVIGAYISARPYGENLLYRRIWWDRMDCVRPVIQHKRTSTWHCFSVDHFFLRRQWVLMADQAHLPMSLPISLTPSGKLTKGMFQLVHP